MGFSADSPNPAACGVSVAGALVFFGVFFDFAIDSILA
jgi:hypothetical protein